VAVTCSIANLVVYRHTHLSVQNTSVRSVLAILRSIYYVPLIHGCCSPARRSPILAQISFTLHSCPFHFSMPPISPHSPSPATASMDNPARTGAKTCSTTAAPAAVTGRPYLHETPQIVTTSGRHPPSQTNFIMNEYDDQGNLKYY
jgi:hypothetical protein